MELIPIKIQHGEEKAWNEICGLPRADVCGRTGAVFDEVSGAYKIRSFGREFYVNPCDMLISSAQPDDNLFLGKLKDFFRMAVLWYMNSAMDIPQTGRLVRPVDVKGGTDSVRGPMSFLSMRLPRNTRGTSRDSSTGDSRMALRFSRDTVTQQ